MAGQRPQNNPDDKEGTPRWVKVSGIVILVLLLLFAVMQFAGIGGKHGPGRHIGTHTSAGFTYQGTYQP